MKIIANVENKTLRILENERSIFRGEYGADKLELYINKQLINEYPTITALLSNGRKIGPYSTDEAYTTEIIDNVTYTKANFTLSKANGFTLSEGKMMITIWMNSINGNKQALGNITLNVINTTAFDDGDIIISGDVEGTIVNIKVELENLQSQVNTFNGRITNLEAKKFIDLGTITESPENAENTILNEINNAGIYTFTYSGDTYLMLVNTKDNNLRQIVIGIEMQDIDIKYWIRHPYYDTFMVTAFKTTDKHYVEEEFIKVRNFVNDKFSNLMGGEKINELYDTIKEIADALESNEDVVEAINNALVNKADKKDIPTKVSQLEQDIELGVSEEQVMEIIEENSEQVGEYNIGTSDSYDVDSDNEIPTSKAVAEMCRNAKLVATGTIRSEYIENSSNKIIFDLDNILKGNSLYYIRYYNDDGGTYTSTFVWIKKILTTEGFMLQFLDSIFFEVIDEEYNITKANILLNVRKDYTFSVYDTNHITISTLDNSLIYCTEYDYVEIYELPFTLGGNE